MRTILRMLWLIFMVASFSVSVSGDEAALEELDPDSYDLTIAGERGWGEDIDDDGFWHGQRNDFSSGARHLLSTAAQAAAAKHSAVHAAAVKHAAHKEASRARVGVTPPESVPGQASSSSGATQLAPSGVSLPRMPKKPPVCSVPPRMRFCKNINYAVYRPDEDHTFAELDFDSHAVFKKIVPHMRISERHFELPVIHQCRSNFRKFLCLRNFPRCCHVGLCSKYGDPDSPLTTASLAHMPDEKLKKQKATTVTFLAGSQDHMRVEQGLNDTVNVKVADTTCLQYVQTYAALFDCHRQCHALLSDDCLFMLSQACSELCMGVHTDSCATKALYQMATGKSGASTILSSASVFASVITALLAVVAVGGASS